MPIFDYQCLQCAHIIEDVLQRSDEDLKYCPECGAEDLRKSCRLSWTMFIFPPLFAQHGGLLHGSGCKYRSGRCW